MGLALWKRWAPHTGKASLSSLSHACLRGSPATPLVRLRQRLSHWLARNLSPRRLNDRCKAA